MDRLLTVKEVAETFNFHPQTIYKNLDKIPYTRTQNKSIRFRSSDIKKYLEDRTVKPLASPIKPPFRLIDSFPCDKKKKKGGKGAVSKKRQRWNYGHGFGGIFIRRISRGEDRYYIWFYDENGERQRKVIKEATSKEQAELALYTEVHKVFDRKFGNNKAEKRVLFCDFAKQYLEGYTKSRKKSWKSDRSYLNKHLIPFFGKMNLSEISPLHVQNFVTKELEAGSGEISINRYLQIMRRMINLAEEYGYKIDKNPILQKIMFNEAKYRRTRVLSFEEEKRLLEEASLHLKPIIQYALLTGCRLQEILGLQKDDIDFEKGIITVRPEINKTGKRDMVLIHSELESFLKNYLSKHNEKSNYVFTYADCSTGEARPLKSICKGFQKACSRANIKDLQFRDLRTTCATRWHERGVDPLIISRAVLRHSSFKMSEQFYIQSSIEHMREALNNPQTGQKPGETDPQLTHEKRKVHSFFVFN